MCNGAKPTVEEIIINDVMNNNDFISIIKYLFIFHDLELRQLLLKLMRTKQLFSRKSEYKSKFLQKTEYEIYYNQLNGTEYQVNDDKSIKDLIKLFLLLVKDNHKDILQQIALQI